MFLTENNISEWRVELDGEILKKVGIRAYAQQFSDSVLLSQFKGMSIKDAVDDIITEVYS